jgi:hypothetical protein
MVKYQQSKNDDPKPIQIVPAHFLLFWSNVEIKKEKKTALGWLSRFCDE